MFSLTAFIYLVHILDIILARYLASENSQLGCWLVFFSIKISIPKKRRKDIESLKITQLDRSDHWLISTLRSLLSKAKVRISLKI